MLYKQLVQSIEKVHRKQILDYYGKNRQDSITK